MKKIFSFVAVAAALLVAGNANAQLGLHIGYAPQNYYGTTTTTVLGTTVTTHDTTNMNGFFVGADYNINLTGDLNVNVGLQARYNTHTNEVSNSPLSGTTKSTATQMLLDVPVLFNYGLSLSNDLKISVFAGPTITYALTGSTKIEGSPAGLLDGETDWYGDNSTLKKLDVALSFGAALTFGDYRLFGGYNMGLLNLSSTDGRTYKGNNLFIGFGYNL